MGYLPIPPPTEANSKWTFYPVSAPGDPKKQGMDNGSHRFYHGLGVGDFNQDGRNDVLIRDGWWEAPEDRTRAPWTFHPYQDGGRTNDKSWGTECANIFAEDLDGDGDMDLISSSAHAYGVWWWENIDGKTVPAARDRQVVLADPRHALRRHQRRRSAQHRDGQTLSSPTTATTRADTSRS